MSSQFQPGEFPIVRQWRRTGIFRALLLRKNDPVQQLTTNIMMSFKPKSIFQLTITGFLLVTAILIIALIVTAKQLNGLSDQSRQIISQSVTAMQSSRTLIEQASAMERNALQYDVLNDKEILAVYADRRKTFERAAQSLSSLQLGEDMVSLINSLISSEALAYRSLSRPRQTPGKRDGTLYPRLIEVTYQISDLVNQWTRQQLDDISRETEQTKTLLRNQAILLVSIALALAGVFTALITRPLSQIKQGISRLGRGAYENRISISGPRDLIELGNLLDWLRTRLHKLEQQRSLFFRHVSHELKTPLAAIQESTALLNDGVVGTLNEEQAKIATIQNQNCKRLQVLIDDLLRYNSSSFSVLDPMPVPVRLDTLVENVVGCHELILSSCEIAVDCRLCRLDVNGNEEQYRVIIDNLVTNAIKYSPRGGTLQIRLAADGNYAVLDVMDEGPGIAAEERDKVFDPFYQGTPSDKEYLKGSGLGLAIAREYAHANGGDIHLGGEARGAHFRFTVPLRHPGRNQEAG